MDNLFIFHDEDLRLSKYKKNRNSYPIAMAYVVDSGLDNLS